MGEGGEVFVLDMGEPVKIVDLARDLIRLVGPSRRRTSRSSSPACGPGEKLYEELLADADATLPTAVPRLRIARLDTQALELDELLALAGTGLDVPDDAAVREALLRSVPGYHGPSSG